MRQARPWPGEQALSRQGSLCSGVTAIGLGTSGVSYSPAPLSLRAETSPDGEAMGRVLNTQVGGKTS